ncbi:MAG: response regulator [Pseudomonadota bacterium]
MMDIRNRGNFATVEKRGNIPVVTQSLRSVVESTVELAAPRASEAGLSLHCHMDSQCERVVNFDAWCVSQLLSNLLSNALSYTPKGCVRVYASCELDDGQNRFELRVEDTGPGIAPEILDVVFTLPDQRESLERAERVGFGLVIARQLCDMLNAQLTIEQPDTGGTVARVHGVLGSSDTTIRADRALPEALRDSYALIIDSDVAARRLLEARLRSWGISVNTALDIPSGITELRTAVQEGRSIGMVFVSAEVAKPALATFIEMLRNAEEFADILLVMLAPDDNGSQPSTLSDPIANTTLSKPIHPSALFDCITRHPQVKARMESTEDSARDPDFRRVLLVEDNIVNQCVATEILKRIGVQVEIANHGGEALELLQQQSFDFVFMDCQMPEMDGFEATRRIRQTAELESLPVVALTANALSGDRQRCLDAGMSDYLTKPFTKEQLETMLDKWIRSTDGINVSATYSDVVYVELIDDAALDQIRMLDDDGDSTIFDEILDEYFVSSERLVGRIRDALDNGDAAEAGRCAHALKSSSAAVGLAHFASQCAELEQLARDDDPSAMRSLWANADRTFERSTAALAERRTKQVA